MGIDRIGKGSIGVPAEGIGRSAPAERAPAAGAEFKVPGGEPVSAVAKAPLDRLRAGEIDVAQYLDLKVSEATAHLDGRLGTEQLGFVRDSLRQQLASDPVLVDLVQGATGALPPREE